VIKKWGGLPDLEDVAVGAGTWCRYRRCYPKIRVVFGAVEPWNQGAVSRETVPWFHLVPEPGRLFEDRGQVHAVA